MTLQKSALVIIDVQHSFPNAPYWQDDDLPAFREALLKLDAGARAAGVPVIHIYHESASGPFSAASGFVRPLDWLPGGPAASFTKHTHNAFTDTGLDLWLRRAGIGHLVISGIRTEQCCETTTRVAGDIGYSVDFVTEATLTFPMTHRGSGQVYSPAEIKARTELVLQDRFARITDVEGALARLQAQKG